MKKNYPKPLNSKLFLFFAILASILIVYSCRKDSKSDSQVSQIAAARAWYESTYPINGSNGGKLVTQGIGGSHDLSQWIKPDWQHPAAYTRGGKNVVELPIDPAQSSASRYNLIKCV